MKKFPGFIEYLLIRLQRELPGSDVQRKMSPVIGELPIRGFKASKNARNSAVLALLIGNSDDNLSLLLTLRSGNLKNHRGQISFPGGMSEGNETPVETALRETWEETGIDENQITVLGSLSDLFVPPSNSVIKPIVAFTEHLPELKINSSEVEEIFEVKIKSLIDDSYYRLEKWDFNGTMVDVPFWSVHPRVPLWGATAMMIMELLTLYNEYFSKNK